MKSIRFKVGHIVALAMTLGAVMAALPAVGHEATTKISPPRPTFSIEPTGEVTVTGSYAVLTVHLSCPEEANVSVYGSVTQDNVVTWLGSYKNRVYDCTGAPDEQQLIVQSTSTLGARFRPGKAFVNLRAKICLFNDVYAGCRASYREQFVQLSIDGVPLDPPF